MLAQTVVFLALASIAFACSAGGTANSQNQCFYVYTTPMAWMDAENFCKTKGGHLAAIHNLYDSNLAKLMASACPYYYIGGVCNGHKCHWVDNSQWNYNNWQKGEPGSLYHTSVDSNNGQWKTVSGDAPECFVCQSNL